MIGEPCIAVLACGTRGDVQPLLSLAIELCDGATVTLVTHSDHQTWVREPAKNAGLCLQLLSDTPARTWATPPPAVEMPNQLPGAPGPEQAAAAQAASRKDRHRSELLAACQSALAASDVPRPRLIIFNLFALEGFHIAEALGVPCIAASPCLVPYSLPTGFERRFQLAHPQLHRRLQAVNDAQQQALGAGGDSGGSSRAGSVGWSDVRHWLWPLFTEPWGAWRHHCLGLPSVPYSNCPSDAPLPPPPLLLYGVSELVAPRPGHWPAEAHMCGDWSSSRCFSAAQAQLPPVVRPMLQHQSMHPLPLPLPLTSQQQQQRQQRQEDEAGSKRQGPAAAAVGEAVGAAGGPICVDFGSMGLLGLLPRPQLLVAVLQVAARQLQRQVLLLTGGWQPLLDACNRQPNSWVVPLEAAVSHDVLLPHCAALLHHGGAGTVAAALRCATPQLICPFHFDQRQWAERVQWLGCGAQLDPATLLQACGSETQAGFAPDDDQQQQVHLRDATEEAGKAVAAAFASLLQDAGTRQQCGVMKRQLATEDGLAAAVKLVRQQLQQGPCTAGAAPGAAAGNVGPAVEAMPRPAVQELELPGGLIVLCISPPEAVFIHREIFTDDCYRLGRAGPGGITLPPGSIVIDAGANIGLSVLRLLLDVQLATAVQRVHAFEPLPPTADVLEANLRQHGVADKVCVHRCGLHSQPSTLSFTFYPAMPGNSTTLPREKWDNQRPVMAASMGQALADRAFEGASRVECSVVTLADFVIREGLPRIDLLKVDVEGCELEVLRGMDAASWAITRQVVAEVHDVGDRLEAVKGLLESQGFAVELEAGLPGNWLVFGKR